MELRFEFTDSPRDKSSTGSNCNRPMTTVGMDMDGVGRPRPPAPPDARGVSESSFIIGRAQCCERNNTLNTSSYYTRYTCIVYDSAEVATLSLPPSLSRSLPSLPFQCAIWKLHAKCGGTHHREGEGQRERRNPFITRREAHLTTQRYDLQRG